METQAITEFIGEYGAGKSQICMQLCVTAQQPPEQGGLGGKVLFIDTEGTFSPQRVHDIAEARGLEPRETLKNIIYARCYNSDHQIFIVNRAPKVVEEEGIRLIVVTWWDSSSDRRRPGAVPGAAHDTLVVTPGFYLGLGGRRKRHLILGRDAITTDDIIKYDNIIPENIEKIEVINRYPNPFTSEKDSLKFIKFDRGRKTKPW